MARRVFIGPAGGGLVFFRISKPGFDAATCSLSQLLFCEQGFPITPNTFGDCPTNSAFNFARAFSSPPLVCAGQNLGPYYQCLPESFSYVPSAGGNSQLRVYPDHIYNQTGLHVKFTAFESL